MNLGSIEEYIIKKEEQRFSKLLDKNHEVVKKVSNKFGDDSTSFKYKEVEEYLKTLAPNHQYHLKTYHCRGDKVVEWFIYDIYNKGYFYVFEYKGVDFRGYALEDGTIYKIYHTFDIYQRDRFGNTNWHDLKLCETLEECYQRYLEDISNSKRKHMTYYNKKIRDIKQQYKTVLKYHNKELKKND